MYSKPKCAKWRLRKLISVYQLEVTAWKLDDKELYHTELMAYKAAANLKKRRLLIIPRHYAFINLL